MNPRKCQKPTKRQQTLIPKPSQYLKKSSPYLSTIIHMAKSSIPSVVPLTITLVLILSVSGLEARKLLKMEMNKKGGSVSSMEKISSLMLSSLPKGSTPPSSPSDKGHAVIHINGRLFHIHLPTIQDRMLGESVPSPGIGH